MDSAMKRLQALEKSKEFDRMNFSVYAGSKNSFYASPTTFKTTERTNINTDNTTTPNL
jgi:hypothetical protein